MTESGHASSAAFQDLSKAYQEMAVKNSNNLTVAIKQLSGVKSPAEFIEIQQRLIKDGVHAAVTDSQNIAHLTAAVFTAAFEPVKKQVETLQKVPLHWARYSRRTPSPGCSANQTENAGRLKQRLFQCQCRSGTQCNFCTPRPRLRQHMLGIKTRRSNLCPHEGGIIIAAGQFNALYCQLHGAVGFMKRTSS
jgi:hypothetical protein